MWDRTKRLINSYLDDLISRSSSPDGDVRAITRAEIARLSELEVQARASAKVLEKEIAEVELKIVGLHERERLLQDRGQASQQSTISTTLTALVAQRDLLKTQLSEAKASADRARSLREERRRQGEDLANETHLTSMRENLAGLQSGFDPLDPASTLDEMRSRIGGRLGVDENALRLAQAEREMEEARAKEKVDEILARYKSQTSPSFEPPSAVPREPVTPEPPAKEDHPQEKTLGRSSGPIKPID